MYRKTYKEINLKNIKYNVKTIINKYNNYKYYFGVVKANCYGSGIKSIPSIIEGGCNYLAVATLEEALEIRENKIDTPILCLGHIPSNYIYLCLENNITITINSLEYMLEITDMNIKNLKVHLKINTGMNRLGISKEEDLITIVNLLKEKNANIEGLYTHIYEASNDAKTTKQIEVFTKMYNVVKHENIKIIHFQASEAMERYEKPEFVNGCRLGIIMYGFNEVNNIKLKSTFKLYSEIIQIHELNSGDNIGYNGIYKADDTEIIGVVAIGYADGIIRKNTGRYVYINNKPYKIVGNICMDMLFIKIDDTIKLYDKVEIIKDNNHIKEIANYLNTIPYEIMCNISSRVPLVYK